MTLVKVGKREAVFRVDITTAEGTSTHVVLAGDQLLAANRAAKEAGLDRPAELRHQGDADRAAHGKLPPAPAAQSDAADFKAALPPRRTTRRSS